MLSSPREGRNRLVPGVRHVVGGPVAGPKARSGPPRRCSGWAGFLLGVEIMAGGLAGKTVLDTGPLQEREPALWGLVGNTPLLPLGPNLLLKAEWLNPGGSVKDRDRKSVV